jgi:L-lactate dehydrogenase complex protein LldF
MGSLWSRRLEPLIGVIRHGYYIKPIMTGANFAIAETGTFLVCTNEGNADIGAAEPPLHIASIGIENMVPRVEDMGVFLRLLTRSALGEPLTQYSSHFTG